MDQAKEMVALSKSITERLRSKKGEITDDEVGPLPKHHHHGANRSTASDC